MQDLHWQKRLEANDVADMDKLAREAKVDRTYVGRMRRLTSLAPDLIESILLFPQEQQRIIRLLIETITTRTSGIDIRFRTNGIEQIVQELQPVEERTHA